MYKPVYLEKRTVYLHRKKCIGIAQITAHLKHLIATNILTNHTIYKTPIRDLLRNYFTGITDLELLQAIDKIKSGNQ